MNDGLSCSIHLWLEPSVPPKSSLKPPNISLKRMPAVVEDLVRWQFHLMLSFLLLFLCFDHDAIGAEEDESF